MVCQSPATTRIDQEPGARFRWGGDDAPAAIPPWQEEAEPSIRPLLGDLADLVELQLKLAAADARSSLANLTRPLAVAAFGVCLLFAAAMSATLSLAAGMTIWFTLSWGAALAAASGIALLLAAVATSVAARKLATSMAPLRRSGRELQATLTQVRGAFDRAKDDGSAATEASTY